MAMEILYGRRPVFEALRSGRRTFKRLLIAEGSDLNAGSLQEVLRQAQVRRVSVLHTPKNHLAALSKGANHQGVALEASPYRYAELEDLLSEAQQRSEPHFLLLLDLIQDVQNLGALLRTAEAVGVHGVVIQERRAAGVTPAVVSASSGAVEHLHVAQVTNLVSTMRELQEHGVWLAGLDLGPDTVRYDQADLGGPLALVVGSEGQGLRRLVREICDFIISLPMRGQVESLNAAVAGSIALYAAWAARGF